MTDVTAAQIHATSMNWLSKVDAADDPTGGADEVVVGLGG
jgi:hypothetical protein